LLPRTRVLGHAPPHPLPASRSLEDYNVGDVVGSFVNRATDQFSKYPGNDIVSSDTRGPG